MWRPHTPQFVLACGTLTLACVPASLAEERSDLPSGAVVARVAAERRREADTSRHLIEALRLTPGQARRLLPIAEKAAELHLEAFARQRELLPEMLAAYAAFAAEDRLNQGFSEAVERRTAQVHRQEVAEREQTAAALIELEQQAARVLTPTQRAILEPAPRAPRARGSRGGGAPGVADAAEVATAHLAELHDELRELHARKHPQPGPLARHLLAPSAYEPLWRLAGTRPPEVVRRAIDHLARAAPDLGLERVAQQRERLRRLRGEINNWNLINGLHLNQSQIDQIVGLYERRSTARKAGGPAVGDLVALERAVSGVLNAGQRRVVAEYKACLIPPRNLKDPVRVGQARDRTQYENWLATARKLRGRALDRAVARALEREAGHAGPLPAEERRKREALLRRVVREAAAMSDTDFELSREELARRVAPTDRARDLQMEIDRLAQAAGRPGRVAQLMLNRDFIEQLRERGRQLAAGAVAPSADLAAGPQAENCERGCALPPGRAAAPPTAR